MKCNKPKCQNSIIKYIGISDPASLPTNPIYFKQLTISEILTIPAAKPDMEDIISVMVQAEVECVNVISTPTGSTAEGQVLLGGKLVMELKIKQKVVYIADLPTQSVHAAHFEYNASAFVVVPPIVNGRPLEDLLDLGKIKITPYIEDIFATIQDKRTICKSVTLLIDVRFIR